MFKLFYNHPYKLRMIKNYIVFFLRIIIFFLSSVLKPSILLAVKYGNKYGNKYDNMVPPPKPLTLNLLKGEERRALSGGVSTLAIWLGGPQF